MRPEEEKARELYNEQIKDTCYILGGYEDVAYRLNNAEKLNADVADRFYDVVITASDFSWTYAKTHEEYDGPYFYKK